jgi:hypothetical protein
MRFYYNPDPLGEYLRVCPYCKEAFTANHMLRKYCPEKHGKWEYCISRAKRRQRNMTEEWIEDSLIRGNEKILQELTRSNNIIYVRAHHLDNYGYRKDVFLCEAPTAIKYLYYVLLYNFSIKLARRKNDELVYRVRRLY